MAGGKGMFVVVVKAGSTSGDGRCDGARRGGARGVVGARGMATRGLLAVLVAGVAALSAGCDDGPRTGEPFVPVAQFGEVGAQPGQFSYPRAMDASVSAEGAASVWVVDKLARIQQVDVATGDPMGEFRTPSWELGKPAGLTLWRSSGSGGGGAGAYAPAGLYLFVADTHYHRVLVYDTAAASAASAAGVESPEPLAMFGSFGTGPDQLVYTTDVAILTDAATGAITRVYVSEYGGNDRISMYEPAGPRLADGFRFVRSFGTFGTGDGLEGRPLEFNRPQSIAVDAERGWLVVSDACNHRVGVLSLEGEVIRWIGRYEASRGSHSAVEAMEADGGGGGGVGSGADDADVAASAGDAVNAEIAPGADDAHVGLRYPYGLAVRSDGTALVCEFGTSRVQWVDLVTGRSLGAFGVRGSKPGELSNPWAVALVGEGRRAMVLDSGNNRVQGFEVGRGPRRGRAVALGEGRVGGAGGGSTDGGASGGRAAP